MYITHQFNQPINHKGTRGPTVYSNLESSCPKAPAGRHVDSISIALESLTAY